MNKELSKHDILVKLSIIGKSVDELEDIYNEMYYAAQDVISINENAADSTKIYLTNCRPLILKQILNIRKPLIELAQSIARMED